MDTVPASGWQIVQESERVAVLLSGVRDGIDDVALAASFQRMLMAQGAHVPPITIRRVPAIPQSASGKTSLITARVNASARTTPAEALLEEVPHG